MRVVFLLFLFYACGVFEAKEYVIRYQPRTAGTTYHVETKDGELIGKIIREKKEDTTVYFFQTPDSLLLASGNACQNDSCTSMHLLDNSGNKIGGFSAEIYNLYPIEYQVFSNENLLVAKGTPNWLGSIIVFVDPANPRRYLVTFFRPMFKLFNDHWHFDIHEEGVIDLRLLGVLGAFQKACDLNFPL